jgi:magnesium-transporting ATPase (P-type)
MLSLLGRPRNVRAIDPTILDSLRCEALTAEETIARLETDSRRSLTASLVEARRRRYGWSEVQQQTGRGALRMLADQFADFMIPLLMVAAVVSGIIGEVEDSVVILAIVVINRVVGFYKNSVPNARSRHCIGWHRDRRL